MLKSLAGVLSKGSELPSNNQDCGVQGRYGMYTLVNFYGGWIEATILVNLYGIARLF